MSRQCPKVGLLVKFHRNDSNLIAKVVRLYSKNQFEAVRNNGKELFANMLSTEDLFFLVFRFHIYSLKVFALLIVFISAPISN